MISSMLLYQPDACWWTVFRRDTSQVIGQVGYLGTTVPGMGYIIGADHWRQGYGAEAVNVALRYGFTALRLNRVELWIHEANVASQRLAYKVGFTQRGQFYQRNPHHTEPHETLVFGLRADEWAAKSGDLPTNKEREIAFLGINPVIRVANVSETIAFYRDRLGFTQDYVGGEPPDFAILSRGEWSLVRAQIHFVRSDEPVTTAGSLYITVSPPVDRLCDEFRARGVTMIGEPSTQSYGYREFTIEDNNGWRLTFSAAT
jgi:uncharacterized glyoxalase superfamily protein PhnB